MPKHTTPATDSTDVEYTPTGDIRSDEALVAACAGGDPSALGELYARHHRTMRAAAAKVLAQHSDDADDAVQEVFARLPQEAARFRPGGPAVRAWLYSRTHYIALRLRDPHRSHRRDAARTNAVELTEAMLSVLVAPDPVQAAADREQTVAAREAERARAAELMARLSPRLRETVELCRGLGEPGPSPGPAPGGGTTAFPRCPPRPGCRARRLTARWRPTSVRCGPCCPRGRAPPRHGRPRAGWQAPRAPRRRPPRRSCRTSRRGRRTGVGPCRARPSRAGRPGRPRPPRAARVGRREHDPDLGLDVDDEGDPAVRAVPDVVAHRQAEGVTVEGESRVDVVHDDVHAAERDGHGENASAGRRRKLLRNCSPSSGPGPRTGANGSASSPGRWTWPAARRGRGRGSRTASRRPAR